MIDSGVGAHHDVDVAVQVDFVEDYDSAHDPYGHDTHVAGIAAGEGGSSQYVHWGQAWKAGIVSLRVLDDQGRGTVSNALAALDWILGHGAGYDVTVVNLSIGKAIDEEAALDPLVQDPSPEAGGQLLGEILELIEILVVEPPDRRGTAGHHQQTDDAGPVTDRRDHHVVDRRLGRPHRFELLSDHAGDCVAPCQARCPAGLDIAQSGV